MKITIYLDNGHVITLDGCAASVIDALERAMKEHPQNILVLNGGIYVATSKINYFKVEE